jgi:hypothetical protein
MSRIRKQVVPIGHRFGRLVVIDHVPGSMECTCDCGTTLYVANCSLVSGRTKSCGCLRKEATAARSKLKPTNVKHSMSKTRTYKIWVAMRNRCNPATKHKGNIKYYVSKGVTVCDRWKKFENFFADMGEAEEGLTIDRKDSSGNYEPSNCRWATRTQQNRNMSSNHWVTINGVSRVIAEWADVTGIPRDQILKISQLDDWRSYEP